MKKSFIVFGCGRFGSAVAESLTELGNEVLAVDADFDKVQAVSDKVTTAICCDVLDDKQTEDLGLRNFDCAVVGIGSNLEASIMATLISKEAGIKEILSKANNARQGNILKKLGANKIVYPEIDTGKRVAYSLTSDDILDYIELSSEFSLAEIKTRDKWLGKDIKGLNFREEYGINILGIKKQDEMIIPNADTKLNKNDILLIFGNNNSIKKLENI